MALALAIAPDVGTPEWWVNRLYLVLQDRRPIINNFDDYYRGNFPLPWLAPQARDEFLRVLAMSRANYTGLVIDAQCERMAVEGFFVTEDTDGNPDIDTKNDDPLATDAAMQRIWQSNNLDTFFDQGLLEAAITGQSYLMIERNAKDPKTPHIYVEHSSQVVLAFKSGTNRREVLAALKVWTDEWTGQVFATLFLEKSIHKFQTNGTNQAEFAIQSPTGVPENRLMPIWNLRSVQKQAAQGANPLGYVPIWELPNNPRLLTGGQSEIYDLTDTQDRIVKTIVDRMMTQDYGAFPQKWISGWPDEDGSGNPTPEIEVGRDRVITTEVAETKFGQFAAADIQGYILAKQDDVIDMASRSRTPAQYLLGSMNNVNGDTLKASESGLVAKVRQRMRGHNDPLENAMMRVREMAGLPAGPGVNIEVQWRNPEFRTEGELVDALLKMADLGVPEEALWGRWGATPEEVRRWKAMLEDKMKRAAAGDATVILAERYRAAAAGPAEAEAVAKQAEAVAKAKANGGGANSSGTQPGQPRGTRGPGNARTGGQSGGNARSSSSTRRANAPKPSTT
jgi:hypothetical protein